jgi:hypothetical protein
VRDTQLVSGVAVAVVQLEVGIVQAAFGTASSETAPTSVSGPPQLRPCPRWCVGRGACSSRSRRRA